MLKLVNNKILVVNDKTFVGHLSQNEMNVGKIWHNEHDAMLLLLFHITALFGSIHVSLLLHIIMRIHRVKLQYM